MKYIIRNQYKGYTSVYNIYILCLEDVKFFPTYHKLSLLEINMLVHEKKIKTT